MLWIIVTFLAVLAGIGVAFFVKELQYKKIAIVGLGVGTFIITLFSTFQPIPAGQVGVVYTFGAITGQVEEGLQVIAPWQDMKLANIQVQKGAFDTLDSDSKENQKIFVKAVINFQIAPENVQTLYRNVGPNYYDVLIAPRVQQIFKEEAVKYEALDIQPEREKLSDDVAKRLKEELAQYSITLVDVLVDDISFTADFEEAIEAKQIVTQNTLAEKERITQREYEAAQAKAIAQGKADAIETEALGQAKANKALAESLTPILVQFQALQKLADNIQIAIIPSGEGVIVDPTTLLKDLEKDKP